MAIGERVQVGRRALSLALNSVSAAVALNLLLS